ncbi:hypothetical protein [Paratissierella segnis]|nr:hypothetical protein [Paratissierella segnis]
MSITFYIHCQYQHDTALTKDTIAEQVEITSRYIIAIEKGFREFCRMNK